MAASMTATMTDSRAQFADAIRAAGLIPPDMIEPGKFHKFPGEGKRNGNTAAWCKLFPDGVGGIFGDYSTGLSTGWQASREMPYTPAERETFKRHIAEAKAQAEAERKAKQAEAASKAAAIWQGAQPAPADHAYLTHKGIQAHGARLHSDALVIPMRDGDKLHSLQFIGPDGEKRFLTGGRVTGCYYSIGTTNGAAALCITEGFATGATIHEATGYPVAVAFNAGNLEPVAKALRGKLPGLRLIVCADDDVATKGNPGITKATEAARAVGGLVAIPDFGTDRPEGATDFNDLHQARGPEAVKQAIAGATAPAISEQQPNTGNAPAGDPGGWPEPLPLVAKVAPEPYPIDALPATIRAAVEEVQAFTKAPIPMVASSALAALSLATQAHADITRADKLCGPVGLFLLTIADSGERKSTCDGFFTSAIRDYQEQQAEVASPLVKDFRANLDAWEAKRGGIKEKIRQLAKGGKPTTEQETALRDLEDEKPEAPRVPKLLRGDDTPENLAWVLSREWPSSGVLSSEAGIVLGAHGMGKDSIMRNLGLLNILWDGGTLSIGRRTSDSFTVSGARLTMALQVQEATLRSFFDRSGGLARGTGFLARFLVAWPESTQGFRPFTDPPASWPALAAFNRRIAAILDQAAPINEDGSLSPPMLSLASDAKAAWVAFHDAIEGELPSGGELYDVRDVASKSADNAARLAALFQIFEHGMGGAVGLDSFEGASRIAAWHLNESRRFFGELALPAELADAARLDTWLIEHCRRTRTHFVGKNHVRQHGPLRDGPRLDAAIRELADLERLCLVKDGKRLTIQLNPALVGVTP
jgi:putative DNA primase/helicase